MRRLLVGDIQAFTEYFAVAAGLVQQIDEIAVFKDILNPWGGQQVLDVLGDARGDAAPFAEAFPNLHAPAPHLAAQQKVELVHIVAGSLALAPVHRDTVPHLVLNDQHPQVFELLAQFLDIKTHKTVVDIHVGTVVKDIQTAMHIQLQGGGDPLGLRFRLPLDFVVEVAQDGDILRLRVSQIWTVNSTHRPVDHRLFHWLQTVEATCRQLTEGQDKIGFQSQRVVVC